MVKTAGTEGLGVQKPRKPHGWRNEEYDRAVAEKDLLYQTSLKKRTAVLKRWEEFFTQLLNGNNGRIAAQESHPQELKWIQLFNT